MSKKEKTKTGKKKLFLDFFIVFSCIAGASYSLNLFRLDLFSTINRRDEEPVGTITIKNNTVQRRPEDRVIWDRLMVSSPLYSGDLIRVAENSSAALNIENSSINLGENTIIRIVRSEDGDLPIQIKLDYGSVGINSSEDMIVEIAGIQMELKAGTVFQAANDDDEFTLDVSEGAVLFKDGEDSRELLSGSRLKIDSNGEEQFEQAVMVRRPGPNERFLNESKGPHDISFMWNRINLEEDLLFTLEISEDKFFYNTYFSQYNLFNQAQLFIDNGLWYWRLYNEGKIFANGQFFIIDASGPVLSSPVSGSFYRYSENSPLRFQWSEKENASSYMLEISQNENFDNIRIKREIESNFQLETNLETGRWYWRVKALFPQTYSGNSSFSSVSFFTLEVNEENKVNEIVISAAAEEPINNNESSPEEAAPQPQIIPAPPQLPLLTAPVIHEPQNNYRIGIDELIKSRSLKFSWSPVQGANSYIISIFRETGNERRRIFQIFQSAADNRTNWTLEDLSSLGRGSFYWQVEAVFQGNGNTIERRGRTEEINFIIDIPPAGEVILENPGVFYGG